MDIGNLLLGLLVAALVYVIAGLFLSAPIPLILALIVLVLAIFRGVGVGGGGRL